MSLAHTIPAHSSIVAEAKCQADILDDVCNFFFNITSTSTPLMPRSPMRNIQCYQFDFSTLKTEPEMDNLKNKVIDLVTIIQNLEKDRLKKSNAEQQMKDNADSRIQMQIACNICKHTATSKETIRNKNYDPHRLDTPLISPAPFTLQQRKSALITNETVPNTDHQSNADEMTIALSGNKKSKTQIQTVGGDLYHTDIQKNFKTCPANVSLVPKSKCTVLFKTKHSKGVSDKKMSKSKSDSEVKRGFLSKTSRTLRLIKWPTFKCMQET